MGDVTVVRLADDTVGTIALYPEGVEEAIAAKQPITVQIRDENGNIAFKTGIPVEILN